MWTLTHGNVPVDERGASSLLSRVWEEQHFVSETTQLGTTHCLNWMRTHSFERILQGPHIKDRFGPATDAFEASHLWKSQGEWETNFLHQV
ncbi:hypothetical protein ACKKBG_A25410 [Auxenochlorella protothecoides x Auxenochlorella symbiontica]